MWGGAFENEWIIKSTVWSGEIKKLRGLADISKKESCLRGVRIYYFLIKATVCSFVTLEPPTVRNYSG